ncbi:MAG: DUF2254 domain-containing protein [Chthoniobacterales bacterium]
MKMFLSAQWERLQTSYWFVPSLLAVCATALSFFTVHLDTIMKAKWIKATGWIWAGGPEGARNVLATIAGSTITGAGVVFSITIVSLTLASSQFGPRLLRNFMADRATQFVLGVFVATFLYCLLVLRTIRGTDAATFVPYISVTCGLLFAVGSVGFLIFFIHHVSSSILAENLIARVAEDLQDGIERLFPEKVGEEAEAAETPPEVSTHSWREEDAHEIHAERSGFIQAMGSDRVLEIARENDLLVRLYRRPGDFVAEGSLLVEVWPKAKASVKLSGELRATFLLGRHRTPTQDLEYSIDQLVEVAVRALSPGINDPFTAMTCIEWLGVALLQVSGRKIPSAQRFDDDGKLRVIADVTDFAGIAAACLNQIRQYGSASVAVTIRLLDMLERVASEIRSAEQRAVLAEHARKIRDDGVSHATNEQDQREIEELFASAEKAWTSEPERRGGTRGLPA